MILFVILIIIFNYLKVNRFYIINMNNQNMNINGGHIIDVLKSNLMTMMMFKSVNNNSEKNNN